MASMKSKLKKALPRRILYYYYLVSAVRAYLYDIKRRVYDKVYDDSEQARLQRDLTVSYHIIEKGLTMPEPRPGFGKQVMLNLVGHILRYDDLNLPRDATAFTQAVSVVREYVRYHREIGHEPDQEVKERALLVEEKFPGIDGQKQIRTTRDDYFRDADKPFDLFCRSRYSVRHYADEDVPLSTLYECIELAQRSPSFCNRQPSRVWIVKNPGLKQGILALQNGNRGFGHLADTLLVITSVISTTKDIHERNENHLNGGMFITTLLQALHYHKIGACALNWSVSKKQDQELRKLLAIPENEVVLLVVSCGFVPERLSVAASPRLPARDITYERL